ncbi:hypothetical protein RvY_06264 [Ramazzottius varieornatus]|uniref:S1 motif domain-containing protein n=1 Tax=Ramazzottius varieornatus TaxID=947166 RepID=A0A1D1V4C4_RAMVA|nr:hypothetical protein RvY_06264 [Ramazzottius varieornatus]
MEERAFPRGGGPSTTKAESSATNRKRRASSPPATFSHKVFTELGDIFKDSGADNADTPSGEKFQESNIFTKLKKLKLATEKRREAARLRKKNRPQPAKLVREEDRIIEHLTYTTLTPGLLLLGRIKEFLGSEIAVTLPGGLRGFVSPFDVSDAFGARLHGLGLGVKREDKEIQSLLQLFPSGQMVICKVKEVETSHNAANPAKQRVTVRLTMNPKDIVPDMASHIFNGVVMPAAISSVEEYGYVMDVGMESKGIKAFLPKARAVLDGEDNAPIMAEGQVLICAVESGGLNNKTTVVRAPQLTRNIAAVKFTPKNISPVNLLPGAIVDVVVRSVSNVGLRVECGSVQGYVSRFHLISPSQSIADHKEGERISARVLYTNPVTKQTAFTLKSTFWDTKSWNVVSHGDLYEGLVVESAEVMSVVEKVGVYLKLSNDRVAFTSRKNMSIPPSDNIKPHFKVGSVHKCVVTGFNDMDEIVLVSLKENLVNQPFLSYQDLHIGQAVECKVIGRVPSGVVVRIGDRIQGFVPSMHLTEVALKNWQAKFPEGTLISCKVMELEPEKKSLVLTHKKSLLDAKDPVLKSYEEAQTDRIVTGVISKIRNTGMLVRFFQRVYGWVPMTEFVQGISLENLYYEGQTVKCKVLRCDQKTENLQLSLRLIKSDPESIKRESSEVAAIMSCRVAKITPKGLEVRVLPAEVPGFIPFLQLADKARDCPNVLAMLQLNEVIPRAVILKMTPLVLSVKPAYIEAAAQHDLPSSMREMHVGREVVATVNNVKNYGLFVEVANSLGGLVPNRLNPLSAGEQGLEVGDTVLVKVEEVNEQQQKLLFRFLNRVDDIKAEPMEENEVVEADSMSRDNGKPKKLSKKEQKKGAHAFGDVVTAKIVAVESQRLKVRTPAKMVGHVHKSELADDVKSKKADLTSYHVGQVVSVRVIGQKEVKPSKGQGRRVLTKKVASKAPLYIFSMRTSVLTARDADALQKALKTSPVKHEKDVVEIKVEDASGQTVPSGSKTTGSENVVTLTSLLPRLSLPDSFSWNEEEQKVDDADDLVVEVAAEEGGEDEGRRNSRKELRQQERQIYDKERSTVKEESGLETEDDFEKLVLTQPNKSMPWIQYMAFLLQNGKVQDARNIAQKALNTISFREETERYNVWIALLNLENLQGTEENLDRAFQSAIQHNDAVKIHRQMAAIYTNTGKHEKAEALYKKMTHKFKTVKEVWMDYGGFLMMRKETEEAHQLMQRAIQTVDPKTQTDIIVKFALLELQYGSRERARTMFENLVASYPKRTDLLHVYLSQMIKANQPTSDIRKLFEKIIHMKLPAKKMKIFFRRYLEFEEKNGSAATVEHVRREAQAYVDHSSSS